jgi:hypothetical protein
MEFLRVSDNGRFLVTESGAPFFWLGDTAWELFHRLNRDEADLYLSNRAAKGFNVIQAVVLAERDGLRSPNANGDLPLYGDDPTRLNDAYFAYVDEIICLAQAKNLYIGLLPTWGDKVDLVGGTGPVIFNEENAFQYGELLGERYRQQPNIIWILGGDRYPEGFIPVWRAMAEGIIAGTRDHALITYHPRGAGQSSTHLHHESWLAFNLIQSGHGDYDIPNWTWVAEDYALRPVKPTLDSEPNYEYHPVAFDAQLRKGRFSDYDVRKAAYRAVLSGACGHTYGHHSIWQMYDHQHQGVVEPGVTWKEALDFPGAFQMGYLRRLIESRPFLSRIPDNAMLISPPEEWSHYVVASRDRDGSYALVYIPTPHQIVTCSLRDLTGSRFNAWWFDPRTGQSTAIIPFYRSDNCTFTSPAHGSDWVLVIDDIERGFPNPSAYLLEIG